MIGFWYDCNNSFTGNEAAYWPLNHLSINWFVVNWLNNNYLNLKLITKYINALVANKPTSLKHIDNENQWYLLHIQAPSTGFFCTH